MQFSEVPGHRETGARLRAGVRSGRVAHASGFDGPEGSGALGLALAYARYLHCENRTDEDSCGNCASCKHHDGLAHPDLHFTFPFFKSEKEEHATSQPFQLTWRKALLASPYIGLDEWVEAIGADRKQLFISVHEALEINRKLSLKAFKGGWKVWVCWLPETMRVDTANKLLKLIEEPPDATVMIFVTEHWDQLLATIRSRVQAVRLPRLTEEEAAAVLVARGGLNPEAALEWASVVEGNVAAGLRLSSGEGVAPDHDLFVRWMRGCYGRDAGGIVEMADAFVAPGREGMKRFLLYAMHMIRQSILLNYGVHSLVKMTQRERAFAAKFAPFVHHGNVLDIQELLEEAHRDVSGNVNGKLVFMDLSIRLNTLLRQAM